MTEANLPQPSDELPKVEDVVLAEMSGIRGLPQDELWQNLSSSNTGQLGVWALGEAKRYEDTGQTARDAFLAGVGYAVTAMLRQLGREQDKEAIEKLLESMLDPDTVATNGPSDGNE